MKRDFNMTKAAQALVCNGTCIHFVTSGMSEDDSKKVVMCKLHSNWTDKPKSGTCEQHSLKGYTGGMGKISNCMLFAKKYADVQKESMKRDK